MNEEFFDSVDEKCRSRFESDWLSDAASDLDDYLPKSDTPMYLGTLHELVHVDLEFRWKKYDLSRKKLDDGAERPTSLATYLERFPALKSNDILPGLILAEFDLRQQYQDGPRVTDYVLEFGKELEGQCDIAKLLEPKTQTIVDKTPQSSIGSMTKGIKLGRYKLVAEHGRGGFGAVWRADDTKMGRRIALKQLGANLARQSESRRRFVSEARVTARLEHPGIVPVYDMSNLDDEHAYYTMKLVRGDTMAEKIKATHQLARNDSQRSVEEKNLLRSFLDVCNTIDYCHARGVVHRDIKPQNVVVGNFGETIVLDWGLASVSNSETEEIQEQWNDDNILTPEESVATLQGSVAGTPGYMPPEQAGSEYDQVGAHSDIYSLGAMLYHIIAGQTAFTGGRAMSEVLTDIREGRFPKPRAVEAGVPRALEAICLKAMERLPRDRYETVKQLSSDVERFLADEPIAVCREPMTVRLRRWIKKNQTLATSLTVAILFAIVACIVGWMVHQNAQEREIKRVSEIRDAALQAEASGMLQLSQNQWESSLEFFEQGVALVADEAELTAIAERLDPKAEKLRAIVEAYEYADRAQHYLFNDHLSKAAIYAQASVLRCGVLEHDDWWNHLAVDGMNPKQVQYLRDEVYRLMGMWAAMRFAETTPSSFSFDWFLSLASGGKAADKAAASCRSAKFAAAMGQRYRPSNLMKLINFGSSLMLKEKDDFKFPVKGATNSSDAAMLGTILDNNISENTMVMRMLMADRDPERAAEALLMDGLANIPDWYWLTIFVGENLQNDKRFRESIRMFSHAVGIKPDGWMAFSRRASAYIQGSLAAKSETEKNTFLKNALLDIQRAEALAPNAPEMLFDKGALYSFVDGIEGVSDAYMRFAFNIPFLADTLSQHRAEIIKNYQFKVMLRDANHAEKNNYRSFQAARMGATAALWIGDLEEAKRFVSKALEYEKDDATSQMLAAIIDLQSDIKNKQARDRLQTAIDAGAEWWVGRQELAETLEELGMHQAAEKSFEKALDLAQVAWQTAVSELAMCRSAIRRLDEEQAVAHFRRAVRADLSVNISSVEVLLKAKEMEDLTKAVQDHRKQVDPFFDTSRINATIARPALKNGDFELELPEGWGESKRNSPRVWEIANNFWTIGVRDTEQAHRGEASFKVNSLRPFVDDKSMSLMPQEFPVTPGMTYRVTVWCKADSAENRTLGIYSDVEAKQAIVAIPGGTYDWRKLSGQFTPTGGSATIVVACKGKGTVWIDDLTIEAAD